MRILLLWDYYESYLRQYYLRNPGVGDRTYAEQNRLLLSDGFSWNAYLVPEFRKLGHEAEAIVGNAAPAQMMWARENNITCTAENVLTLRSNIVREQIR